MYVRAHACIRLYNCPCAYLSDFVYLCVRTRVREHMCILKAFGYCVRPQVCYEAFVITSVHTCVLRHLLCPSIPML